MDEAVDKLLRGGPVTTRFAPSPTGPLHLGHAWSAVLAHDRARAAGGRFLLRIEDIDASRARPDHVDSILADLDWLGLAHDGDVQFQSRRTARYAEMLDRLDRLGLVYRCFCTRAAIAASASAPHGSEGPVYPGTCRRLSRAEQDGRAGEPHGWRIDMGAAVALAGPLDWHDSDAGRVVATPRIAGDVVLARKDAPASYHLSAVIDDADSGVTDIVRGSDLFTATHVHRLLQAILGLPVPRYHHHPLILGPDGTRLAKRHGSPAIADLRRAGSDGRALANDLRAGRLPLGFTLGSP